MKKMKTITINGQQFVLYDEGAVRYDEKSQLSSEQQAMACENIGVPVHYIESQESNPVSLRSLESGSYLLKGTFLYYDGGRKAVTFDPERYVLVDRYDDRSELLCFMPTGNMVMYVRITDTEYTLAPVKFSELENTKNRVTVIDETADDQHYPTAKAVYNAICGVKKELTPEEYLDITADGVVSLKAEYQSGGSKNAELPETIIIPDVINGTAVSALSDYMFQKNLRVKSITIPNSVIKIPVGFANEASNLAEIKGTENIEVIGNGGLRRTGLKKALFPRLKTFEGTNQFDNSAYLSIVDIGNTVSSIPRACFASCESLSLVLGGASVTSIGYKGFHSTRSLKNLPILENVKSIEEQAFVLSRVNFDWWNHTFSSVGENGTPAEFNPTKWWDGCTYVACENPLGSTFHQKNPEWNEVVIPGSSDTYGSGCVEISTAHIYSALSGVKFDSPRFFVENIVGGIDNGSLLDPTKKEEEQPAYGAEDMVNWLTNLGLECEHLTSYNSTNLQKVYDALKEGALIFTGINPGHAGVLYGVASNGEMLVLDSNPFCFNIGDYEARTFQQPIWSLVKSNQGTIIVKNRKVV